MLCADSEDPAQPVLPTIKLEPMLEFFFFHKSLTANVYLVLP